MVKKYFKKIIAQSPQDLQIISACCSGGKVKLNEIKFLPENKIFLFSIERLSKEREDIETKIKSIIKFEYVQKSKSKNIDQSNLNSFIELVAIDVFKKKLNYEIILLFLNNAFITLTAEIIEVVLEDQNEIKN